MDSRQCLWPFSSLYSITLPLPLLSLPFTPLPLSHWQVLDVPEAVSKVPHHLLVALFGEEGNGFLSFCQRGKVLQRTEKPQSTAEWEECRGRGGEVGTSGEERREK